MAWTPAAEEIFHTRLLIPGETINEGLTRVALASFPDERGKAHELYDAMLHQKFFPNSPAIRNLGDPNMPGLPHACFVLPIQDSLDSIYTTLKNSAKVHQAGGGTGFSFSSIRPYGSPVRGTLGIATGPVGWIDLYDRSTNWIKQGSQRRGANMAVLSVYHPDIIRFIRMKRDRSVATNFNVSVAVDNTFFRAVKDDSNICQAFPIIKGVEGYSSSCTTHNHVRAKEIFDEIVYHAWENGEPGILFEDRANEKNPHPDLYTLEATNPCGEQWLGPYESCVLGSINVSKYYVGGEVDYYNLQKDIPIYVEALDNMIDVARYPISAIEHATKKTRRIGLGIMGWADLLFQFRIRYGSIESIKLARELGEFMNYWAKMSSMEIARRKGSYRLANTEIRNAARTTIAPTGTLARLADCSFSIEPAPGLSFVSKLRLSKEDPMALAVFNDSNKIFREWVVNNPGKEIPDYFVDFHDISVADHISMQATWQQHFSDNSISKTINAPAWHTVDDAKDSILLAFESGCLGWTYYRDGSREDQVLTVVDKDCNGVACTI